MSNARNLSKLLGTDTQITTADIADGVFQANKNLIINGAMQVAQRGTSFSSVTATAYYIDRFQTLLSSPTNLGTWTISQSTTAPSGFSNSLKYECTTANASPASGDYLAIFHKFEGQDLQHLKKGTANAESLTLSFWVRSNKTGTYNANLNDSNNGRLIGGTYSISSANTWEYKTITYSGDTTGAFNSDNSLSLIVEWWLGSGTSFSSGTTPISWESLDNTDRNASGTVNLADTVGNTFYITGVQLELGSSATPFEHRSFGDELLRCQRYFCRTYEYGTATGTPTENNCLFNSLDAAQGYARTGTFTYPVSMRATPTVVNYNTNNGASGQLSADASNYSAGAGQIGQNRCHIGVSGITIGASVYVKAHATADAEL